MAGEDRSSFGFWQDYQDMQQNGTQLTATEEERQTEQGSACVDTPSEYDTSMLMR